ncbi:MAG: hypothetical protein AAF628_18520 [Planctomycetota bacterium]
MLTLRFLPSFCFALAVGLAAAPASAQQTWVVDASGAGQFTDLPPAYDQAAVGDTILVRPGSYSGFARPAKGVRILGDGVELVTIVGAIAVNGLPVGQRLVLSGLRIAPPGGPVALYADYCWDVLVNDCALIGPDNPAAAGGVALLSPRSYVVCDHVLAVGGDGLTGGAGASFTNGCYTATASTFRGGNGAPACICGPDAAPNGVALDECELTAGVGATADVMAQGGGTHLLLANHTLERTVRAHATGGGRIDFDGAVSATADAQSTAASRSQPSLVGPRELRLGERAEWKIHGASGNSAVLFLDTTTRPFYLPFISPETWVLVSPTAGWAGTYTTSAGAASLSFTIPQVPSLADAFVYAQAFGWVGQVPLKGSAVCMARIRN